jgi:Protein of unknown function (DUF1329)
MKRRDFGFLAASSLAAAATARSVRAQAVAPDPSLLGTTLTPLGAERAGNADGSIPAWTGGNTAPPLPSDAPAEVAFFADERPLYAVDPDNMAQYQNLLSAGTQQMMKKYGLSIQVYPTHRTAAAPQFVYDNTAKNVMRAVLDPAGGRLGFTGAYGGIPFPIINTSDPMVGGAQLIWNHLTGWANYAAELSFAPSFIVTRGNLLLVQGALVRYEYPYYDPAGSPETFDGYYSKLHLYYRAPGSSVGEEQVVWHTTNVNQNPDIVWELLNGQGRVRKAPDEAFDTPNPAANGISNQDETSCFYGNPSQYDWTYIGRQELLVPYNCNNIHFHTAEEVFLAKFPNPEIVRWEKHRVWVVEATLHPGEQNVLARRRFYMDEDTWYAVLGEGYDADGNMVKCYTQYLRTVPSIPATNFIGTAIFNLISEDYTFAGGVSNPPFNADLFVGPQSATDFEPQEMAASAAF